MQLCGWVIFHFFVLFVASFTVIMYSVQRINSTEFSFFLSIFSIFMVSTLR